MWRRQWQPTPVLLPGKSHGRRSLVGCSPWGRKESDMTEWLHFHFSLSCIGEGHGNPLQCSCLENPRDRGAWWAVGHNWSDLAAAAAVYVSFSWITVNYHQPCASTAQWPLKAHQCSKVGLPIWVCVKSTAVWKCNSFTLSHRGWFARPEKPGSCLLRGTTCLQTMFTKHIYRTKMSRHLTCSPVVSVTSSHPSLFPLTFNRDPCFCPHSLLFSSQHTLPSSSLSAFVPARISPQSCLDHPLTMEDPSKIPLHLGSLHTMSPLYSSFSLIKDICFMLWCVFHSTESTAVVKRIKKKNNLSSALVRLNSLVYIVI